MIGWYLDEDSEPHRLAADLRRAGYVVVRTGDAGNSRQPDSAQLEYAAANGLVILTANIKDFRLLHRQWLEAGREHAGIVIRVQGLDFGEELRRLLALGADLSAEDMRGNVQFLSRWRSR